MYHSAYNIHEYDNTVARTTIKCSYEKRKHYQYVLIDQFCNSVS